MTYSLDTHPRESKHHDIFVVRKDERQGDAADPLLDHFRIDKTEGKYLERDGTKREPVPFHDQYHRPVMNLAFPAGAAGVGPVLSALPVHPDPAASSACSCYLINTANLRYETAWTAEEWNQVPNRNTADGEPGEDEFSLLIATPAGKVYFLRKKDVADEERAATLEEAGFSFETVDLKRNPELWTQLRNGCVVGRVRYQSEAGDAEARVPIVNVHSLL